MHGRPALDSEWRRKSSRGKLDLEIASPSIRSVATRNRTASREIRQATALRLGEVRTVVCSKLLNIADIVRDRDLSAVMPLHLLCGFAERGWQNLMMLGLLRRGHTTESLVGIEAAASAGLRGHCVLTAQPRNAKSKSHCHVRIPEQCWSRECELLGNGEQNVPIDDTNFARPPDPPKSN